MSDGCEGFALPIGAVLIVVLILMIYYIYTFVKNKNLLGQENCCGSMDQLCKCSGNETFVIIKEGTQQTATDADLSRTMMGG